jgi:hypothetical protein
MKLATTQLEVLFFTGTTFAHKELHTKYSAGHRPVSEQEALVQAFWNGMLFEMLPELDAGNFKEEKKFLWQVNNYNHSLWLNLCNTLSPVDNPLSVDPYKFTRTSVIN